MNNEPDITGTLFNCGMSVNGDRASRHVFQSAWTEFRYRNHAMRVTDGNGKTVGHIVGSTFKNGGWTLDVKITDEKMMRALLRNCGMTSPPIPRKSRIPLGGL